MKILQCKHSIPVLLGFLLLYAGTVMAQQSYQRLVWSDEFEADGLPDAAKWTYDTGRGCPCNCGWGNNELQYYTDRPQNAIVQNGLLKIIAQKEDYKGSNYTSARLLSKGKFEFTYGRVVVRARIPMSVGTWPAIWMLGNNIDVVGWPKCGEIDIMEHRGYEPNKIFGTLHYPDHAGDNANGQTTIVPKAGADFHIYAVEWRPTSIEIFADGNLVHSVANDNGIPFHHDFFLLLNIAVGGNFTGKVDPAFTSDSMEIDYVRVYQ